MIPLLDLGCGGSPEGPAGAVGLDSRRMPGVRVVARVPPLPFLDGTCAAVRAEDLLEHLGRAEAIVLLDEVCRVLVHGGTFSVETIDLEAVARSLLRGDCSPELAARHLYCYSSFGEQWHRWAWTRASLTAALTAACLGDIEEEHARAWHNLRFKARKG